MTRHSQVTGFNKPASGAQGHSPHTDADSGSHHDTGMAGDAPAALGQVAQRILGNEASAGLMDAINTSQSTLGNRNFMQFIKAARQQTRAPDSYGIAARAVVNGYLPESLPDPVAEGPANVAPVSNRGDEPLQMMWRNPGRGVLRGLTNKSALNRDRTSPVQPAPRRDLSISPGRQDWNRDILFGANSTATLELAVKLEASTDSAIPRHTFKQLDRVAPYSFPVSHLWDKPAFDFADRNLLTRRKLSYMAYVREAIATAMERGGNIYWALGRLQFQYVFSDLFRVRMEHGLDPIKYMAEVSYPDLMDKHGLYIDADTGQVVAEPPLKLQEGDTSELEKFEDFHRRVEQGRIITVTPFQPLITSVEIIGFLMGDERKFLDRTSFFDARHRQVDREKFLADFSVVHDHLRSRQAEIGPENNFILEPEIYRPLDLYSRYPCGHCDKVFTSKWELENHWKSFPVHGP